MKLPVAASLLSLALLLPKPALAIDRAELGKQLFFDRRLSKTEQVSCSSCHNLLTNGTDNRPVSTGIRDQKGARNSPTVWNAALWSVFFWDGRAATLEEQAKGPFINPLEMGMPNHDALIRRIQLIPGYVAEFNQVFGKLDIDSVASAIAAFERTLIPVRARGPVSPAEKRGLAHMARVGCLSCHAGPDLNGPATPSGEGFYMKFPLIPGTAYEAKYQLAADLGRFDVTKKPEDKNMWRVPSLRNVAVTAPYFHNGSVATLDEAVRVMAKTQHNTNLKPEEVAEIVAYLTSLTDQLTPIAAPNLPND